MQALDGLKVLELGQLIAGPFAGRMLADFGADVIKIESRHGGDPLRRWREMRGDTSLWWEVQSRGKRSLALDLGKSEDRVVARRLAVEADVVIENFRPGKLEEWSLDHASLATDNPGLVMLRISGYGQDGPYAEKPGFGLLGEAMAGLRYLTGEPDRVPVRTGVSIGDSLAGLHGVIGVLIALRHRDATGEGQVIDTALYESVFNVMESLVPEYTENGVVRQPAGSALPGIAPSNAYTCKDGTILIGGNGDRIFRDLMTLIGRDDLATDDELAHNDGRAARVEELDTAIGDWTKKRSVTDALEALDSVRVPSGRIYSVADIVTDPHYKARDMLLDRTARDGHQITMPGIVPKLSRTPGAVQSPAPQLGEHDHIAVAKEWPKPKDHKIDQET
jgi:formyl-CoA transferase